MVKYVVKCPTCNKDYADGNYNNCYIDSLTRTVKNVTPMYAYTLRCCPYCDKVYTVLVSVPKSVNECSTEYTSFRNYL